MNTLRVYETTLIVNAALEDSDIEAVITKITGYIENNGGNVKEINKWGRRRLAYPINKKFNGFYIHTIFEASPDLIPLMERFLVLEDTILRHLTLELSEKLIELRQQKALAGGSEVSGTALISGTDSDKRADRASKSKDLKSKDKVRRAAPVAEKKEAPAVEEKAAPAAEEKKVSAE